MLLYLQYHTLHFLQLVEIVFVDGRTKAWKLSNIFYKVFAIFSTFLTTYFQDAKLMKLSC